MAGAAARGALESAAGKPDAALAAGAAVVAAASAGAWVRSSLSLRQCKWLPCPALPYVAFPCLAWLTLPSLSLPCLAYVACLCLRVRMLTTHTTYVSACLPVCLYTHTAAAKRIY